MPSRDRQCAVAPENSSAAAPAHRKKRAVLIPAKIGPSMAVLVGWRSIAYCRFPYSPVRDHTGMRNPGGVCF